MTPGSASTDRTALAIREQVVSGRLSPSRVVEEVLARIDAVEPDLHSLIRTTADRARTTAARIERELAQGREPGPLCGVPFTVKDTMCTAGAPTTVGSLLFRDATPAEDALCVQRMTDAGAILVGKSNLPELAALPRTLNRRGPECVNPHDFSRVAGGSSGGAAAGVVAGIVPVALGTDAGGSNRIPAAYCGCVGVAPTLGRVPHRGGYRSTPWVTVTGPLTVSVADAAAVTQVLAQPCLDDPVALTTRPDGVTVLLAEPRSPARVRWVAHSGIGERIDARAVAVAERGCRALTPRIAIADALANQELLDGFLLMLNTGRLVQMATYLDDPDSRELMSPEVVRQLDGVRHRSAAEHATAVDGRLGAIDRLRQLLDGQDLVATPTVGFVAPDRRDPTVVTPALEFTFLPSYAGFPTITVPVGVVDDLPVGLQLIARPGDEATLFQYANELERGIRWELPSPI